MRTSIDILAPEVRADPYPHYAVLRRDHPVCLAEPGGMWLVSRHDDIMTILRDPARFSSQGFRAVWEPPWLGYNPLARSILAMDGPAHTRLRALASRSLGPRAVARLEPAIRARCERLLAGIDGDVELVAAYAAPLPAFVIADLLGLDESLGARFKRWADDFLSVTPEPLDADHPARVRTTIAELSAYLTAVIADRRRAPVDDTVSDLVRAEVDGQRLGDGEILEFMVAILLGGLETTTHLIATSALFLAARPDLWSRLRADPAAIPAFVEEMLRFDGPTQSLPRFTTCDVDLAGVTIPAGSLVLALLGSACRDERRFVDPDRFDIDRGSSAGLNFGHGVHFCLGAALARMEAQIALDALVRRFARPGRLPGEITYNRTMTVRGPVTAPLRLLRS
ncbi:cytochrome P450 [Nannocystis punicea]|uniref:Cytochrome P450 n=1 Tax=Nannocystis punicea TaxID=2995304 RepID=A0ABY7H8N4_9BACT|nr:cytochrome P450 [Nannocystis poenicansa]WAS95389.1 cytochrome P450 [Nannocystis poenicansa]